MFIVNNHTDYDYDYDKEGSTKLSNSYNSCNLCINTIYKFEF